MRRAVELTEQTAAKVAESGGAAKVFTFGELIHNRDVVNRLREAGIAPIESLDEAQRGVTLSFALTECRKRFMKSLKQEALIS